MMGYNYKFCICNVLINSSRRLQNLVTLASSRGASTSSNTQIGEGLVRKTAKINDKSCQVLVLHQIVKLLTEVFFQEDLPSISNPASKGSSESTNSKFSVSTIKKLCIDFIEFSINFFKRLG